MADSGGTVIQTSDLDQTFQALKNQDPARMRELNVPRSPDYKAIPNQNYALTTSVHGAFGGGMSRFASASSNAGMIYGQPQFFSPVHTPINWQIPSKRIEIYQWNYLPHTQVLMEDFTYGDLENISFNCSNIFEDSLTGGFIFEVTDYPKIMNSEGIFNQPPRISMRDCKDKRCFSFEPIGSYRSVKISEEHHIYVLDGKAHRENKKVINGRKYRAKNNIKPNGVEKVKIQEKLIKRIQAKDVSRSDYLLTPVPKMGNISLDKDIAWLIGFCIADGCLRSSGSYEVNFTGCKDEKALTCCREILEVNFDNTISSKKHGDGQGWRIRISDKKAHEFFRKYIINKGLLKKFSREVFDLDKETRLNILAGYFDGDGSFDKRTKQLVVNCYAKDMIDQIYWLLISCGVRCSLGRHPLYGQHYPTSSTCDYRLIIPSSNIIDISSHMKSNKVPLDVVLKPKRDLKFFYEEEGVTYLAQPINKIKEFLYTGKGFDIEMPNERKALVADGYISSNCRFFYQNEPKVAAAIDFYSYFPLNDFENECKDRDVKKYFDKLKKRIDLAKWLRLMSHEIHLLGDCFPFLEISCELCGGSGRNGDELCEHEGGTIRRVVILNPDYVEVFTSPINPEAVIALKPDEELINMVQKRSPGYDRLTPEVRALVSAGRPIRLDNRNVSHLKYGEGGYDRYGIGMVRRLFPILSYKTKLMVAQWIVAERLIIPIKIVKVGSDERPAGPADIAAVQEQLAQTSNDPNLTIVTHNAFEIDWIGACFSDDTEALTENGWKKYSDILKNYDEKIATYNLNNGCIEYQIPTEYHEYDYNGEMCYFHGKGIDVKVTPNHNMLAQKYNTSTKKYGEWKKILASDIDCTNHHFRATANWEDGKIPKDLPFKKTLLKHLTLNEYLEFVGYYVSEGGLKIYKNRANAVHITQAIGSPCFQDIKNIMYKVGKGKVQESFDDRTRGNPVIQFYVNDTKLGEEVKEIFGLGSLNKKIPRWILSLPKENLSLLMECLMDGDGSIRESQNGYKRYKYTTISKTLADQVQEILIKMGFSASIHEYTDKIENHYRQYIVNWSELTKENDRTVDRKNNISKEKYNGKVWCFTVPNGFFITRRHGKISIHGNSGKVLTLSNEFELINQEILDGMMINNALLNGEGPTFASASVGIEAMIERLQTFRKEISNWIEQKIYLPEAKRQGFIDENANSEEDEYIYPKVKWNSMHLRDQQQFRTFVLQLYEKGLLSAQTVLEAFDFDPDQEIERKRYDAIQMAAVGQGMGGGAGGGMPGMDMGGGFGGGGGAMPGTEGGAAGGMPGGAPGGMPGGAPISAAPGPSGAPAMATTKNSITILSQSNVANPANYGGRVLKQKTRERLDSEKQKVYKQMQRQKGQQTGTGMRDAKGRIVFTKCERQLLDQLQAYSKNGLIRYPIIPQFEVKFGSITYPIDFAFPHLKIAIEADGEAFHSSPKQVVHDKERDMKLAGVGWTVLRFKDEEIEEQAERVMSTIVKTIMQKEASLEKQKETLKR